MPGLVGKISWRRTPTDERLVASMMNSMLHESFYSSGTYFNSELQVALGWTAHEGSFSDCLPVWSEDESVALFFSGENFAENETAEILRGRGHVAETVLDARYLVHLYEEKGEAFTNALNGSFVGLVVDLRKKTLLLFNDRYGSSRLYIYEDASGLYFAAEAKAILNVVPALRTIDPQGLAEFLTSGCALQNRTLFPKIFLLPPGVRWSITPRASVILRCSSFDERGRNSNALSDSEYSEKLASIFASVVPRYFRGIAQIGMSLTGGLDGRMILASAKRPPNSLPCYTFGSTFRDCRDVLIARKVASACGQSHQVIPVDGDFLHHFPKLAERAVYLSDGAMDLTGAVELYINRIARDIAPVRMTGNYGSEIVRSNIAFKPHALKVGLFSGEMTHLISQSWQTYAEEATGDRLDFITKKQVPWHHHSRASIERSQLTVRSPFLDNEIVATVLDASVEARISDKVSMRLVQRGNPLLAAIPTDRGLLISPTRTSAIHNRWQNLTFKAEYAYDYGMPQSFAAVDSWFRWLGLGRWFLGRHKFYHFRIWYRDQLASYVKEILLDPKARSRWYLAKGQVESIVRLHTSGLANYTTELHKLLALELLHRQLID